MYKIINLISQKKLLIVWPFLCLTAFLGAFYYFTAPMLWLDIKNANEADINGFKKILYAMIDKNSQIQFDKLNL